MMREPALEKTEGTDICRVLGEDGNAIDTANEFLSALVTRGLARGSILTYGYALVSLHRWLRVDGKQWAALIQADLMRYIDWQRRELSAEPRTINHRLTVCRTYFRFCFGHELPRGTGGYSLPSPAFRGRGRDRDLGLHPLKRQKSLQIRVKVPRKVVQPLTADEVKAFLRQLRRYRDLSIALAMLLCGLRSCEILALQLQDIQFLDRRLLVRGKGGKERTVPLPMELAKVLKQYILMERPVRSRSFHAFVVLQGIRRGQPLTASGIRSLFRHRRLLEGLEHANAHRFRHTFGADMAREGVRLPILQRLMGHADPTTTLQYIELSMQDIAQEYDRAMSIIHKRYN